MQLHPGAESILWAFGFDRVHGESMVTERLKHLLGQGERSSGASPSVLTLLEWMIDELWKQQTDMKDWISSDSDEAHLVESTRSMVLWLLGLQHFYLDRHVYKAVHEEQQRLISSIRVRFVTEDFP